MNAQIVLQETTPQYTRQAMRHLRSAAWIACLWAASQLAGCLWTPNGNSLFSSSGPAPGGPSELSASTKPNETDLLPPKQAAQACLATAKECKPTGMWREAILLFERARQLNPASGR